jgi:hypothetical protein
VADGNGGASARSHKTGLVRGDDRLRPVPGPQLRFVEFLPDRVVLQILLQDPSGTLGPWIGMAVPAAWTALAAAAGWWALRRRYA